MSIKLSKRSIKYIESCHEDLKKIIYAAADEGLMDFSVICGHRGEKEQNEAYEKGFSKAKWGQSSHNSDPSLAFDAVPYPLNWNDFEAFKRLGRYFLYIAKKLNIKLYWGGNWKHFKDYPHYSLNNK